MLVCHCKRVGEQAVRHAVRSGAQTVDQVGQMCDAGTGCNGCHPLVEWLLEEEGEEASSTSLPIFDEVG
jgi:bacterioferritin-associated ferredoxin